MVTVVICVGYVVTVIISKKNKHPIFFQTFSGYHGYHTKYNSYHSRISQLPRKHNSYHKHQMCPKCMLSPTIVLHMIV